MKAIRTIITMAMISMFTMGLTQRTWAAGPGEVPVELKVISNVNNAPLFELKTNNQENEYLLKVKDANGAVLFTELLKGNVIRKYKLDLSEADISDVLNVRFEVTDLKTKKTLKYNVSRSSRIVEDVEVARL